MRAKRGIDGKIPGKTARNEGMNILSKQSEARDRKNRQTAFASWVPESLRGALPYSHFTGNPELIPIDVEESFVQSRAHSAITEDDLLHWCELIEGATKIPNIYEQGA